MDKNINLKNKIIYPFIGLIFPVAFLAPLAMWLLLVLPAIIFFCIDKHRLEYFRGYYKEEVFFLIFIIVTSFSLFWTNNLKSGTEAVISLLVLFFSFIILRKNIKNFYKNRILKILTYSFLFTTVFCFFDMYFYLGINPWLSLLFDLLIENKTDTYQPYFIFLDDYGKGKLSATYSRCLSIITIFSFIIGLIHLKSKKILLSIFLLTLITLLAGENLTSLFAFILGCSALISFKLLGKKLFIPISVIIVLYSLTAPLTLNNFKPDDWTNKNFILVSKIASLEDKLKDNSYNKLQELYLQSTILLHKIEKKYSNRFLIWSFSSEKVLKNFFTGYGVYSSKKIGELEKVELSVVRDNATEHRFIISSIPLHPHNNTIQIWLELGIIGIICFYFSLFYAWYKLIFKSNASNSHYTFISSSILSLFLINQSSYGLWQAWWIASIILLIIFSLLIISDNYAFREITNIPETIKEAPNQ